jgi:hypothetical protein
LTFSPSQPRVGAPVSFSAAGSSDRDGSIVTYRWDLDGDGVFETSTGSRPQASRTYSSSRTFAVKVQVQDNDGATATAAVPVPVAANLKLVLGGAPTIRLATLLRRGLAGTVRCGRSCTVKLTLRIPKAVAKRTKAQPIVARATVKAQGGLKRIRVRLNATARARLRRAPRFALTISGSASDGAGRSSTARRTITVRP